MRSSTFIPVYVNYKEGRKEAYQFVREIVRKENSVNAHLGVECEFVVHVG